MIITISTLEMPTQSQNVNKSVTVLSSMAQNQKEREQNHKIAELLKEPIIFFRMEPELQGASSLFFGMNPELKGAN
jgi:hypothetical protein